MMSRLTADTTQIKAAVGASVSIALRNLVLFAGAASMMVITSPRLSAFVLGAIPVIVLPLVAFGRAVRLRSRAAQDTLADASGYAAEMVGAARIVQAFTNESLVRGRFGAAVEQAFRAAVESTRARAVLTAFVIFLVFASVVLVLWVGAQDVLSERITPGRLGQFVLYAVFAAGALGELSPGRREIAQSSGAAERLFEILAMNPAIEPPAHPRALPISAARGGRLRSGLFPLSDAAGRPGPQRRQLSGKAGREGRHRRSLRRRQEHDLPSAFAVLRSVVRAR